MMKFRKKKGLTAQVKGKNLVRAASDYPRTHPDNLVTNDARSPTQIGVTHHGRGSTSRTPGAGSRASRIIVSRADSLNCRGKSVL
ncbi:hypothetical protein EVAR_30393_1 [Eumeta japonica]|uniref:Uncharacterized protein n=1 Tax=Eumeta variegata TaxID=151549 RepID=A0A4C1W7X2_EUMVA|nr:hypothetical protein EVAR_30393_1 [Eumeta japonica]